MTANSYPGQEGIGKGDLEWKADPQPADPSRSYAGILAGGAEGRSALGEHVRAWTTCTARLRPNRAGAQGRGPPTPPQAGCHLRVRAPRETSRSQRGAANGFVSCAGLAGGCRSVLWAEGDLGGRSRCRRKEHCDRSAMSAMAERDAVPCVCRWLSSPRTRGVGFPPF